MNFTQFALASLAITALLPESVHAFGKKQPAVPAQPADTQAYPSRVVSFGKFLDTPFTLPDGKTTIDMKSLLPPLVLTEMQQATTKLRGRGLSDATTTSETKDRYELRGGITSFEASAFSGKISFGYKPGTGDIGQGNVGSGSGAVTFNVGSLGMDFHIVDTERGEVVAVGSGNALAGGVGLNVDLDFDAIKIPADFVYNSPMTPIFRKAARNAILQMVKDPNTNFFMDWKSIVTKVNYDLKQVFFGAGQRDGIEANNVFTVYDSNDMRLGEIKVNAATLGFDSAGASVKNDANDKILNSVRNGDSVKIFFKDVPH